ncbi:UrcA family protein [Croceicoccus sp. YJ47]|uniref:UrcA family protein n=1 Tax=Croceicoccus sp. YJ47 TaxID=2798724 RepID=UPI0019204196|nr:UrcA family protein [Croceicoccus sp. YJ47]QQN73745.1 UrcA family protein [Croceicoccus sp. YJ47]
MKKGLMVMAACALAGTASTAMADPFVQESATLQLDGINLSTVEGQRSLAIRMDAAANAVCGEGLDRVHLKLHAQAEECRVAVKQDIRNQIEQRMAARATSTVLALRD